MDSSALAKPWQPHFLDPLQEQARRMNLRALVDARRAREMQLQVAQMELAQKSQQQEQARNLSQLLSRGGKPTEQEMYAAGGIGAIPVLREMRQSETAERQAATALLEQNTKRAEVQKRIQEQYVNGLAAAISEKDLERRKVIHDQVRANIRRTAGEYITPELDAELNDDTIPDEEDLIRVGYRFVGQKETDAILNARDTRAEALEKHQRELAEKDLALDDKRLEYAIKTMPPENAPPGEWSAWRESLPPQTRALVSAQDSPQARQRVMQLGLTAQQRAQQLPESAGDWIRIATDPNATREEQARADQALSKFASQSKAGAPQMNLSADQKVGNEAQLRGDYRKESANYVVLRDAWGKIQNASKSATGPGDMSLIFAYMKILDPNSTVREGEYATAQNAGSIPERVWAWYNRQLKGEKLDPNVRSQFVHEARQIYTQAEADQAKIRKIYGGIASRSGLDPENVTVDYSPGIVGDPNQPDRPKGNTPTGPTRTVPLAEVMPGRKVEVKRGPDGKLR